MEQRRSFLRLIWKAFVQFGRHNSPVMAAGMSFFAMLSLIPLTLLGVSLLGYLLGSSEDAQGFVSKLLSENFPAAAAGILEQINDIIASPRRTLVNGISVLGLMWSGLRFFNMLQRVLNDIWIGAKQRRFLWGRFMAFLIFTLAGLLFWAFFILSSILAAARELEVTIGGIKISDVREFWFVVEFVPTFIASIIMLFLVYLFIPNVRVSGRAAFIGATFSAVFLQFSRYLFSFVVMKFDVYGSLYGPLTSFIIFMSWLYLSMSIMLLGAELGSQYQAALFNADTSVAGQASGGTGERG